MLSTHHPATATPLPLRAPRAATRLPRRPVIATSVSMAELVAFKTLMAAEGRPVHLARLCYDRPYAFDCLADAHAGGSDPLRRLALSLFQAYQRRDDADASQA